MKNGCALLQVVQVSFISWEEKAILSVADRMAFLMRIRTGHPTSAAAA
jgi:hypothetical protein